MVFRGYPAVANRTFAILLTSETENLGATGFSYWCEYGRLFLAYAVAGRTMEGRDDLELELIDHIALKVDSTNDRVKGQLTLSGVLSALRLLPYSVGHGSALLFTIS
jgi:hypothetical protein